jgi:ABC-type nickel/cobalt efflux system permease component RcnA
MTVVWRVAAIFTLVWVLHSLLPSEVDAHPLGNFTVNHYSRVEMSGDTVAVRYVVDYAEIPSVQEARAADTDGDGNVSSAEWDAYKERAATAISGSLELTIDNERIPLQPTDITVSQPLGQGDIPLVRLEMWLRPARPVTANVLHDAVLRDRSDPARIGWREMVVHAGPGASIGQSDVPNQDVTDELRTYPDDLLQNPLDRREAYWSFTLDGNVSPVTALSASTAVIRPADPFASLITATELNPTVILLALLGAAALGGIHAASPGHGKSIMAAYIVGRRGTIWHASVLAMSVTLAHTTGVLILGLLTIVASNLIFPDQLYPWLTLVSGAVVLVVGSSFLIVTLHGRAHHHHHHDREHDHSPGPSAGSLAPTWRGLLALGLAGGIVPSGSALVVLLSSIALGRLGFGLVLIVAFGFGMAVVLVVTGVLLVHAGQFMVRLFPDTSRRRLSSLVPLFSASVMTLLGVVSTVQGIAQTGLFGL